MCVDCESCAGHTVSKEHTRGPSPVRGKPCAGMIFLSDEDVDVKRLLARWIKTQPESLRGGLSGWVDDMFYRYLFQSGLWIGGLFPRKTC